MTRVALVTGASRGIGAAIARELAATGCHVLVNYRSDERGATAVKGDIVAAGGEATLLPFDVSNAPETTAVGAAIVLHAISFVPVTLLGLVFMAREGLSLGRIAAMAGAEKKAEPVAP